MIILYGFLLGAFVGILGTIMWAFWTVANCDHRYETSNDYRDGGGSNEPRK